MGVKQNSWLLSLVLAACLVTGVRGEMTMTALIATSCVVGFLILCAVIGALVYCALRNRNRENNKKSPPPPPAANTTTTTTTTFPSSLPFPSSHPVPPPHPLRTADFLTQRNGTLLPPPPPDPRVKAYYTQHAGPHSRHRPPLTFYTVRRDPRDGGGGGGVGGPPGMAPVLAAHPGLGGRPVLYLDMLDTLRPQGNSGTVTRNANGSAGGILIRELDSGDERASQEGRYRKKEHKKSRGRPKSRNRSDSPTGNKKDRSRSRSRDALSSAERDSRPHSRHSTRSADEAPVLARPGDIILSESQGPTVQDNPILNNLAETRGTYHGGDSSAGGFLSASVLRESYRLTVDEDRRQQQRAEFETVDSGNPTRYSVTAGANTSFDTPTADYTASNPTLPESEPTPFEAIIAAGFARVNAEPDPEPEPTPRIDYPLPVSRPLPPEPLTSLERRGSDPADLQPTPRADYSFARDSGNDVVSSFGYPQVRQSYSPPPFSKPQDTAVSNTFDDILNSVNFNETGGVSHQPRPPTPPFDGDLSPRDSVYPPRGSSLRQRSQPAAGGRVPSPPPDIPSADAHGDSDTGEILGAILASARPPTPPTPGNIQQPKESEMAVLRDLQEEGARGRQVQSPTAHLPALPFMEEFKRRYGDQEEGVAEVRQQQQQQQSFSLESMQQRGDDILRGLDAVLFPEGLTASRSHVSFAAEPPQIIPPNLPGSSTSLPPDYDAPPPPSSQGLGPPPPPPPVPPPPPAVSSHRF